MSKVRIPRGCLALRKHADALVQKRPRPSSSSALRALFMKIGNAYVRAAIAGEKADEAPFFTKECRYLAREWFLRAYGVKQ